MPSASLTSLLALHSPPANIMFDKRVVRGSTCTGVKNAEIVRAIQEEAERQSKVMSGTAPPTLTLACCSTHAVPSDS